MRNIKDYIAGQFRNLTERICVRSHIATNPNNILKLQQEHQAFSLKPLQ